VINVDGVLDVLPGPQPNRSSTKATTTKRKGMSSAPFAAAARKRIAVFGRNVWAITEASIARCGECQIFDCRIE